MLVALFNGSPISDESRALAVEERGLAYGDGVFETLLLRNGAVRFLDDHLARLRVGCERLSIEGISERTIVDDLARMLREHRDGVIKLIVTRGAGGRGYRAAESLTPSRITILYPPIEATSRRELTIRWCKTRLSRNAQLAGIKHLNRLENVLGQNEWRDPAIDEGLMLDVEGDVICATASNLFIVLDGVLTTPDLRFSGVRGVMRQRVIHCAQRLKIEARESALRPDDVLRASEVFLTNAIRGVRPVGALDGHRWQVGPVAQHIAGAIEYEK